MIFEAQVLTAVMKLDSVSRHRCHRQSLSESIKGRIDLSVMTVHPVLVIYSIILIVSKKRIKQGKLSIDLKIINQRYKKLSFGGNPLNVYFELIFWLISHLLTLRGEEI